MRSLRRLRIGNDKELFPEFRVFAVQQEEDGDSKNTAFFAAERIVDVCWLRGPSRFRTPPRGSIDTYFT